MARTPPLWLPRGTGPSPGFPDRFASPDSLKQKNLSIDGHSRVLGRKPNSAWMLPIEGC